MRSVRIVSDGTGRGTHIYDADTGNQLTGIQSLKLEVDLRGKARVYLTEKARIAELDINPAVLLTEHAYDELIEAIEPDPEPEPERVVAVNATDDTNGDFIHAELSPQRAIEVAENMLALAQDLLERQVPPETTVTYNFTADVGGHYSANGGI